MRSFGSVGIIWATGMELREDRTARAYRIATMRNEARRASKACLVYGIPLAAIVVVIVWAFSDRPLLPLLAYFLIPIAAASLEILSPWFSRPFRNHWRLTPSQLVLRGTIIGSVRLRNIKTWFVEQLPDLPGYYRVRLILKHTRFEIILSETEIASRAVEEALAAHLPKKPVRIETT
jgi:hypothetical protein